MIFIAPRTFLVFVAIFSVARAASAPAAPSKVAGKSSLVTLEADGRLRYTLYTTQGDTLLDFSHCGYGGGGVALPQAVVRETLNPESGNGDDGTRIQAALDHVSALPLGVDGMRGAVLLRRGAYRCASVLKIMASGVVLRGEGDGEEGTVITATARKQQVLVQIGGSKAPREEAKSEVEITDAYVPVGARSFAVVSSNNLKVGQGVFVVRHGNAAWISEIGMNRIALRAADPKSTKQWTPFDLKFDRVITAIEGHRITVDAPIACAIDRRWGGGAVVRINDSERIERCGVESLRAVSVFDATKMADNEGEHVAVDEDHATHLVAFDAVKNAWARHLTSVSFYHGVAAVENRAKWVTVEDCNALDPVSIITGGRRYPFSVTGQLVLVQRCFARRARHAFVFGARVPGPNVFLDCRSEHDYATSEPHHRWSVGGLYDNVDAQMAIQDRQWMGSGHGWAGANYVVWNSRGSLICQQPPTAQNFAIGFMGKHGKDAFPRTAGWWESEGTRVEPQSLYRAQLAERVHLPPRS
jgi:hypothetical protein